MQTPITEEDARRLKDNTADLQKAYQVAFAGVAGTSALADLARFCRAEEPCWSEDQRHHARLEGRREVWLHLQAWMKLPVEDLMERRLGYSYRVVKIEPEDEQNG